MKHLEVNGEINELQSGFTRGRRLEDNIFILKYCIEDAKRRKVKLVLTAIDFAKAFDSINRRKLIQALKEYKCDSKLINSIAKLYNEDETSLYLNNKEICKIGDTSGIHQGCTGSPQLFIMVVNLIIQKICNTGLGFRNDLLYIPALFFADDGLLLTNSVRSMEQLLDVVVEVARECGLEISKTKSSCMIYNEKNKPENIRGIAVMEKMKYLGVIINDKVECFKEHKNDKITLCKKMANMTYSVTARACNKLLIGKTYWKSVVLPCVMTGAAVIQWNEKEIEQLQKLENSVWRKIFGAPSYTPNATLRGEAGASSMKSRDMTQKLNYVAYLVKNGSDLLKRVFENMWHTQRPTNWILQIKTYMEKVGIANTVQLKEMGKEEIRKMVNRFDETTWLEELREKSTLTLYRQHKQVIREENFYDNTYKSILLFRARTNTLLLNWRRRFTDGEVRCELCDTGNEESLDHFLKECNAMRQIREKFEANELEISKILGFEGENEEIEKYKEYILGLWNRRRKLKEEEDRRRENREREAVRARE